VVPSAYGGCDEFGWAPANTSPVVDVADLAFRRGRPILRIDQRTLRPLIAGHPHEDDLRQQLGDIRAAVEGDDPAQARLAIGELVRLLIDDETPLPISRAAALLARSSRITIDGRPGRALALVYRGAGSFADDDSVDGSSTILGPVTLDGHHGAVRARAEQYATAIALDDSLIKAVTAAAGWHDHGKQDPRFQAMLRGGRRAAVLADPEPLAKSGMDPADRAGRERAQRLAGYPRGMRHEAASAAVVQAWVVANDLGDVDAELVVHLVGAHHGRNRPLLPPVIDDRPLTYSARIEGFNVEVDSAATLDWNGPGRFQRLNQRYGRWGLALLETVVRLADICCSEEGT